MATKTFHLPDLGEGLPDATVVEWFVKTGDTIKLDAPLVSMETAKAVVEVPSPYSGKVAKLYGKAGDVIDTGAALIDVELDPNAPQRADAESTGHQHAPKAAPAKGPGSPAPDDAKKVIASEDGGEIATGEKKPRADTRYCCRRRRISSDRVVHEQAVAVGGVKAVPAVRALAKKLNVDLSKVIPTGADRVVTMNDVKQAAEKGTARVGATPTPSASKMAAPASPPAAARTAVSAAGQPMRTSPPKQEAVFGQPDQLKRRPPQHGARHGRRPRESRADHACRRCRYPGLVAWQRHHRAPDSCDRLRMQNRAGTQCLVRRRQPDPHAASACRYRHRGRYRGRLVRARALRNADVMDAAGLRQALNRIREQVQNRSIPPEELKGYTISLSNFGIFAGRYATPIVVPPCVAIVAAGKLRHDVVAVMGAIETHRVVPQSLTFDHRAATGGEAARFLKAMLDDLALAR